VAACVFAAVSYGCDYPTPDLGTLRLSLSLPDGTTVSQVAYRVLSSAAVTITTGTFDVSDPNAKPAIQLSLPAATGDTVLLTATRSDGQACSGQSAPFNVVAGQSVVVDVTVVCGGGSLATNAGSAVINGNVSRGNNCPVLASWAASPLQASAPGGTIALSALATDADGDALTYSWSAAAGTFAGPGPSTTYVCAASGPQTIDLSVTDGRTPPCPAKVSIDVSCVGSCGNGQVDPGEQCDPPAAHLCSATCQNIVECGNGRVDTGEQCDPPASFVCSATCQNIPPCGNGRLDPGEDCDPPQQHLCSLQCKNIVECGNGRVDTGEQCDPPVQHLCSLTCQTIVECGNGRVDTGEQCDPPVQHLCSLTCQNIVQCGNNRVDPGEQCDPPTQGLCSQTCQNIVQCGNGRVDPGEQCDPPTQGLCSQTCQNIIKCGNGRVDPGEQCDPPQIGVCSQTCQKL
jgi:hypothetical protein